MTFWRSSVVDLADRYCPAAIVHHLVATPRDRSAFLVGTGVHAMLEQVYSHPDKAPVDVCDAVQAALVGKGRRFEGGPVEHLTPRRAQEARDLALLLLDREGLPAPSTEPSGDVQIHSELSVSVDADWQLTERDSETERWRQALDLVALYRDEDDGNAAVIHVFDYKGWHGGESWFDSTQGRAAVCSAAAFYPGADIIRLTVVNYRLRRTWAKDYDVRFPEVAEQVEEFRHGLEVTMKGLDEITNLFGGPSIAELQAAGITPEAHARQVVSSFSNEEDLLNTLTGNAGSATAIARTAVPGVGCGTGEGGCPFFRHCKPALDRFAQLLPPFQTPQAAAIAYALADQMRKAASADLWAYFKAEGEPVKVTGGTVGPHAHPKSEVCSTAPKALAQAWVESVAGTDLKTAAGKLRAERLETVLRSASLGVTAVKTLIKNMRLAKPKRDELLSACVVQGATPRLQMEARKS